MMDLHPVEPSERPRPPFTRRTARGAIRAGRDQGPFFEAADSGPSIDAFNNSTSTSRTISSREAVEKTAVLLNQDPDRFLFGTDTVAPAREKPYDAVFAMWKPGFDRLSRDARDRILEGNSSASSTEAARTSGRGNGPPWRSARPALRAGARTEEVQMKARMLKGVFLGIGMAACTLLVAGSASAQGDSRHDIYGFVMTDIGYNEIGIDPEWFDVQRPTKLPSFDGEFGEDGNTFFSARQTRFGIKSYIPTDVGEIKTTFEFEMFGVGVDAGQTTIRLRHAYGELGKWGAGQYWSPFMDIDVFPNTIEYWGPTGMAFFRNVQLRFMPIQGDSRMTIAIERPGASADLGDAADRIDLAGVTPRFPLPDLSAEYRHAFGTGNYVELAGILRQIEWQDNDPTPTDISGEVTGWGASLSSNLKAGEGTTFRLQGVVGEGVQNYMNDAPVDVGVVATSDPLAPFDGEALPMVGISAFVDHSWNSKFTSSLGYSMIDIDNTELASPDTFKKGQYVLGNVLYNIVPSVMMGLEAGWIERENESDGFKSDNMHVQFSAKYSFAFSAGGGK
jgi:outer membrane DcaP-like protein